MNVEQERSRSPWMEVPAPRLEPLRQDLDVEVLVVGAGIAGLSTAYELALAGRRVAVVDAGRFARGQTARTTAHLTYAFDDYYRELIRLRGEDQARQVFQSQSAAVDRIGQICEHEAIVCDFARVDGYFIPARPEDESTLHEELEAAHAVGFEAVQWADCDAAPWSDGVALKFPWQARFHPLKYLGGLVAALARMGARLHDDTRVVSIDDHAGRVVAMTDAGRCIRADKAVVATNTPIHLRVPVHTKQAPYRTYVIAAPAPKGSVPDILVWDTLEPGYHYIRLQPGETEDLLIVGGEDHRTGEADDGADRIQRLEAWARARCPQMGRLTHAWSGQVFEPYDLVPYIGHTVGTDNIFLVTGDSGQGITTGVAASLILRQLVQGLESPWAEAYSPSRQSLKAVGEYVREQGPVLQDMAGHLTPGEIDSVDRLAPGEGALVRDGAAKVAAYRDPSGALHLRSAVCPHAGCLVHFNSFETCWDCPCHGSQFTVDGEPLNGPAFTPLKEAADPSHDRRDRDTTITDTPPPDAWSSP